MVTDMTPQEAFDKIVAHLRAQGAQSMACYGARTGGARCAYRGDDGRMCAAGVLIPDSEYNTDMEGECVREIPFFDTFPDSTVTVIAKLQATHDMWAPSGWESEFKFVAKAFGLTYTER